MNQDINTQWKAFRKYQTHLAENAPEYDYVAVPSHGSLNHLFTGDENVLEMPDIRSRLVTGNGLLLQHEKITRFYKENRYFPRILISDNVLIHGRGLSALAEGLWEMLRANLDGDDSLSEDELYDLQHKFLQALDIWVFAYNKRETVLKDTYRRRVAVSRMAYTSELREFAGLSCDMLYASRNVANTGYVFSAMLPEPANAPEGWERTDLTYEEKFTASSPENQCKSMTVYAHRPATSPRWISTLRHKGLASSSKENRFVTSMVLFGSLPEEAMESACVHAAALLEASCPALTNILRQNHPQLARVRMQLLSFFASVITFFDFAQGLFDSVERLLADSDLDKISLNFGPYEEIYPELYAVCQDGGVREALRKIVFPCLERGSVLDLPPVSFPVQGDAGTALLAEAGKSIMGEIGARSEQAAYGAKPFRPHSDDGQLAFEEYLKQVSDHKPTGGWLDVIAAFLFLTEDGIVDMNVHADPTEGIQCVAKAGEKATYALVEPISVELPALALVERKCWLLDLKPEAALDRFISQLHQDDGTALDKNSRISLQGAYRSLYQCGHTLSGWDFDAITKQRNPEKRALQLSYLDQANTFLRTRSNRP